MKKYNVIIIGAGPSGLSTALCLNKYGIKDIIVIERFKFPRYKCCAGYVTNKTKKEYENFGLDFNKCDYSLIDDFNIYYKYHKRQNIINKFLYTNSKIDRVKLDNEFYLLAKEKVEIREEETINKLDMDKNIIKTNKNSYKYNYLVFADGSSGFGSKYQNINKKNIAIQYIFNTKQDDKIDIHFGITKNGYGWVSSYNGITNIGLTDVYKRGVNYQKVLIDFINNIGYEKVDSKKITGAFTPIGIKKPIINNNIYYVGDAVGACDPLTLSGLRYGISTGKYCAKAIYNNDNKIYRKYTNKLKIKFKLMYVLSKIFYLKSSLYIVFNIGCKYFNKFISYVFNNFFVNKK